MSYWLLTKAVLFHFLVAIFWTDPNSAPAKDCIFTPTDVCVPYLRFSMNLLCYECIFRAIVDILLLDLLSALVTIPGGLYDD